MLLLARVTYSISGLLVPVAFHVCFVVMFIRNEHMLGKKADSIDMPFGMVGPDPSQ